MACDLIDVKPCLNVKCGRFGHKSKKCFNNATCVKYAGKHKAKNCNIDKEVCKNCVYSNKRCRTEYEVNKKTSD